MIRINDVIDELNRVILKKYPDFTFYVDFEPIEFERPSVFIKFVTASPQERIAYNLTKRTLYFTITYYAQTNDYYRTDKLGLHDVLDGILGIFTLGNILIKDRSFNISATAGGENDGEIYIDLQIEQTEEIMQPIEYPYIEDVELVIN